MQLNSPANTQLAVFQMQNQHQSTSKRHIEHLENQPYLHLFHQAEEDTIQQAQQCTQFPPIHQCTSTPHLSDNPQHQQQTYLSQHISCLQVGQGHLGGRMHIIVSNPLHFALATVAWCTTYQFLCFFYHDLRMTFFVFGHKDSCWLGLGNQSCMHMLCLNISCTVCNPHFSASRCCCSNSFYIRVLTCYLMLPYFISYLDVISFFFSQTALRSSAMSVVPRI